MGLGARLGEEGALREYMTEYEDLWAVKPIST
jgi:hypothetical protein